ncbi:MAG: NUDIX domain-containing protein [Candidatus Aenigmatarchaeota archaeon]
MKTSEDYLNAAIREVFEETGISAKPAIKQPKLRNFEFKNSKISGHTENGEIFLEYIDSGKAYQGRIVFLEPIDPLQEPEEQTESDARNPRYISVMQIPKMKDRFMPACQLLLDLIEEG